jgi:hypothetical protein
MTGLGMTQEVGMTPKTEEINNNFSMSFRLDPPAGGGVEESLDHCKDLAI